jgi:4-amino-4-deoxy-L-arabinose transferase-like glycosyltransferase
VNLTRSRRDALVVAASALVARLAVVAWAAGRFPPAEDGAYYHKVAVRIAEGHGYTWLWPDGVVTYAAHYPVGYPTLVALGYAVFGAKPVVAMLLNALVGTAGAVAVWALVARSSSSRRALAAGLAVALHPALVPYTAALMTEGVTASLLAVGAWAANEARAAESRARWRWLGATGLVMGVATLVRPQSIALAPFLGGLAMVGAARPVRGALAGAAVVTALAFACCAPWTVRNCVRMNRCALVSVNGGWNLAIGTQTDSGGWHPLEVPDACKTVFEEAAKDECFGREARKDIARAPLDWLRRAPAKLRVTFDYFGAAPWYLHSSNAEAFPYRAKVGLGTVETLVSRLLLASALVTVARWGRGLVPFGLRQAIAAVGLVACVLVPGTVGYLALAAATLALGWELLRPGVPLALPSTALVISLTAVTHAVFFGAGRYGLVVVPFVTALAFLADSDKSLKSL